MNRQDQRQDHLCEQKFLNGRRLLWQQILGTHPGLLKRLFEIEVPEIYDGTVELKSVAREAGDRSKISVRTDDPDVDPVGSCVGPRCVTTCFAV